jgi:predicted Zn finger-like uncharacterized protein
MSLITRCPACGTMFKVVPDQLRISEGWVRCGKCSEVFDAARNLQVLAVPPRPSTRTEAPRNPVTPAQAVAAAAAPAPAPEGAQDGPAAFEPALAEPSPLLPSQPSAPLQAAKDQQANELSLMPEPGAPDQRRSVTASTLLNRRERRVSPPPPEDVDALNSIFFPEPSTTQAPMEKVPATDTDTASGDSVADEDVSFVRQARRKAFWRSPVMRGLLVMMAFMLVVALGLQVGLHERNRLASLHPELKPWLVQLCEVMQCTVEVPRQIDAIVIDNSSFTRVRGDLFRLGFVVRNTSASEVAAPAVELTLTDTQEKPVMRRVFQPAELGAGTVLAPRGEWSAALNLGVAAGGDNARVAGYRLLAFYP